MSLRKCFAQQNLELSLFFVYCFLGRKELLFVKTYLFPNCNAVRSEYQNVVQNSQKGTWSKTPAYSYACTVHELKGKPSSFLFYFAGQLKTRGYLWFCTECDESVSVENFG